MNGPLPDHILTKLSPVDREKLGKAGQTASEAQERWSKKEERRIHDEFERWLKLHADQFYWDHSRMDRATTNRVGNPDFVIQSKGRVLNIEFKAPGGKLTEKQREVHAWIERARNDVFVCNCSAEAIALVKATFP